MLELDNLTGHAIGDTCSSLYHKVLQIMRRVETNGSLFA
jgi:hypothetical protein